MLKIKDLRDKQVECIDFTRRDYRTLILADVGTGKTVIALTCIVDFLKGSAFCGSIDSLAVKISPSLVSAPEKIDRCLVLAPKLVATDVWAQEVDEWEHLHNAGYCVAVAAGKPEKARRAIIEDENNKIVALNYENLSWFMANYPTSPFDAVVCDEIDKLKDRTTKRFKTQMVVDKETGEKYKQIGFKDYSKQFMVCIGLTGTPASNHLMDIWAQVYIIDQGQSLGRSFDKFRRSHFYQTDWAGYDWGILPGQDKAIYNAIEPFTFRIERDDQIPPVVELPPRYVDMTPSVKTLYKKFERDYLVNFESGDSVEADNAAVAYGKLRAMAAGFSYVNEGDAVWHHQSKFVELSSLVSELQGQQLIIVYHFKEQLEELKRQYPSIEKLTSNSIEKWNSGELELLALQPQSGGHGLNLQKSDAHHICMLTEPESAGLYEQVIGRLRRTGNNAASVFVHRILTRDTVDIEQDAAVHGKIVTQAEMLNEMKKRCE